MDSFEGRSPAESQAVAPKGLSMVDSIDVPEGGFL